MGLILDTNVFIAAERNQQGLDFSQWYGYGHIFISAITATELLAGVHMAKSQKIHDHRALFVESILESIPVLDVTLEVAKRHAPLYALLYKQGQMIGAHDLLIAATALANECAVLTTNVKEFNRIPDLTVLPFEPPPKN